MNETLCCDIYKEHFVKDDTHQEYLAVNTLLGPVSLSYMVESQDTGFICRIILRTNETVRQYSVTPVPEKSLFGKVKIPSIKEALKMCEVSGTGTTLDGSNLKAIYPQLKLSKDPLLVKAIANMDEKQLNNNYKFGVLLAKRGQKTEQEFFSNSGASGPFQRFLDVIATNIVLKGWKKYRAGLDVQSNIHGTNAYYTEWHGHEIMLHVANLIPYTENDVQQLERKRHIGNDIVVVVFEEEYNTIQSIDIFRSHQNREPSRPFPVLILSPSNSSPLLDIIVIVSPAGHDYHVRLLLKDSVPPFEPTIPATGAILKADETCRELFMYWRE